MAGTVIDELVIKLGAAIDPRSMATLAKFHGQMAVVANSAIEVGQKIYNAFQKISTSIIRTADDSLGLEQLAQRTGMSTDAIQALGYAVEATGGSMEDAKKDLDSLGQLAAQRGMPLTDLLDEMADEFGAMTPQEAKFAAGWYGISDGMTRAWSKGKAGLHALMDEAAKMDAIISPEDIKTAAEADRQWKALTLTLKVATATVLTHLLPKFL